MDRPPEFDSLFKLPAEQRRWLAQELWDSVEEDEVAPLPIPQWQVDELRRRYEKYRSGESKTLTWEEVKRMTAERVRVFLPRPYLLPRPFGERVGVRGCAGHDGVLRALTPTLSQRARESIQKTLNL